jgi:hypothetical protein
MPAPIAEELSKALFGIDEYKGYVDSAIKTIAPLLIGAGLGSFVPFPSPFIITGLASHLLYKAVEVAGWKIEVAYEQLQQYEKEGDSKAIFAKVASPCLGVLRKIIPAAPERSFRKL